MTLESLWSLPLASSPPNAQALPEALNARTDTAASSTFLCIRVASNLEVRSGIGPSPHTAGVPRFSTAGRRPPTRHDPLDADCAVPLRVMQTPCQTAGPVGELMEPHGFNGFLASGTARPRGIGTTPR